MAETRSTEGNQGNGGSRDERVFIFGEDARFRWLMARERILGIPFFTGSVDEAVAETWCVCGGGACGRAVGAELGQLQVSG